MKLTKYIECAKRIGSYTERIQLGLRSKRIVFDKETLLNAKQEIIKLRKENENVIEEMNTILKIVIRRIENKVREFQNNSADPKMFHTTSIPTRYKCILDRTASHVTAVNVNGQELQT